MVASKQKIELRSLTAAQFMVLRVGFRVVGEGRMGFGVSGLDVSFWCHCWAEFEAWGHVIWAKDLLTQTVYD